MKNVIFSLFIVSAMVLMSSCEKEGPAGPAGPAGAAGVVSNFSTDLITIPGDSWAGNTYTELEADFITEAVMNEGAVIVYVQDDFGYWNSVPSAFHPISGYGYSFDTGSNTGVIGFEVLATITTDVNVKVITMDNRSYQTLQEMDVLDNAAAVEAFLNKK